MLARDEIFAAIRSHRGNLPGLVVMYLVLVGSFAASAAAIL